MLDVSKGVALGLGGLGLAVAGLYLIRRWQSRKWICLSRMSGLSREEARLDGQVVIITGANTGLGYFVGLDCALRGADAVILACRDWVRGNEAAETIRKASGHERVTCMQLDLADLQSVRQFAQNFSSQYDRLDCLVCNAGVFVPMKKQLKTADGYEIHFGVNHLGHFLLMQLLMPKLQSVTGRVIMVSSWLMMFGMLDMDKKPFVFNGREEQKDKPFDYLSEGYCDTKQMNALVAKEAAFRLNDVTFYSVCPGWCSTELSRYSSRTIWQKLQMLPFVFLFMRSAEQGSQNIVYLMVESQKRLTNGGFYRDGVMDPKGNDKLDDMKHTASQLWTLSCQLLNL